jgi:hypothetical protein
MVGSLALLRELQTALPLQVTGAKRGVGSFITLNVAGGSAKPVSYIWVYLCDWRLVQNGQQVLTSSDVGAQGAELPLFLGHELINIDFDGETRTITLVFDEDIRLSLSPNLTAYEPVDDLVMFFRPSNRVVAFSCASGFHETD